MPVSAPFMVANKLHELPRKCSLLMMSEPKAANDADIMVLTTESATAAPSPALVILSWDPPLKARNPKNRMKIMDS